MQWMLLSTPEVHHEGKEKILTNAALKVHTDPYLHTLKANKQKYIINLNIQQKYI